MVTLLPATALSIQNLLSVNKPDATLLPGLNDEGAAPNFASRMRQGRKSIPYNPGSTSEISGKLGREVGRHRQPPKILKEDFHESQRTQHICRYGKQYHQRSRQCGSHIDTEGRHPSG